MRNFSKKILISALTLAILLSPMVPTFSFETKTPKVEFKKIQAQNQQHICSTPEQTTPKNSKESDGTSFCIYQDTGNSTGSTAYFDLLVTNTKDHYGISGNDISWYLYDKFFDIYDENGQVNKRPEEVKLLDNGVVLVENNKKEEQDIHFAVEKLNTNTSYFLVLYVNKQIYIGGEYGGEYISDYNFYLGLTFVTGSDANKPSGGGIIDTDSDKKLDPPTDDVYGCYGLDPSTWFTNCIAMALYKIVFVPLAEIAKVAAMILDFFIYYSTNSSSYSSAFVERGWSMVRDIANIFFIITLLFIAIKTVLNLNVSNNKKLISMVIIIALLINFSLFTTRVVIDASNILAKIFYNNISSVDENQKQIEEGGGGERSISVGLVAQFNPHEMIIGSVIDNLGEFVVVTSLSILLVGYMIYIFISVAALFVARVVSLWLSMIFSPLAFISYALPFKIPEFGHDEWWKKLIESAMLAPLFIFFLYIIIMFGDFFHLIQYDVKESTNWFDSIMKTMIPFGIVFILLQQAKKLASKYAGEIGVALNKAASSMGGLALGAVAGGTAMLTRGTVGRLGSVMDKSASLKQMEAKGGVLGFGASKLRDLGKFTGSASFDVRNAKVAGKSLSSTGLNVGEGKKGGFEKARQEKTQRRQKRAEELKVTEDEKLKQELNKTSTDLQTLLDANKTLLENVDKEIESKAKELHDISAQFGAGSDEARNAGMELQNAKNRKKKIRTGGEYKEMELKDVKKTRLVESGIVDKSGNPIMTEEEYFEKEVVEKAGGEKINYGDEKLFKTSMGEYKSKDGKIHKRTIENMQKIEKFEKEKAIEEENRTRVNNFADKITKWNRFKTNRDAAYKMRMGVKIEDKNK